MFKHLPLKDKAAHDEGGQQQADDPHHAGTPQPGGIAAPFSRIQECQPYIEQCSWLDEFRNHGGPSPEQRMSVVEQPDTVGQIGDSRRTQQRRQTPVGGTGLSPDNQDASHCAGKRRDLKRRY